MSLNSIEGFLHLRDEAWLSVEAGLHVNILEIGSWKGKSTRILADYTSGVVSTIDAFGMSWDGNFYGEYYDEFVINLGDHLRSRKVYPIVCDSRKIGEVFGEVYPYLIPFDFIFIDGGHDYDTIKRDIDNFLPFCSHLFSGHDYSISCPDVKRAVNEKFGDRVVCPGGTEIWCVYV